MPKISVHLECDSAEELQRFFLAFRDLSGVDLWDGKEPAGGPKPGPANTRTMEETPEPAVEQPAAQEPAQPRRGRPRKDKSVGPAAEPAVSVVLPGPGDIHEGREEEAEARPETKEPAKPVKAKEPEIVVSRQDLLDAFSEYVQRYGASFGFSDISSLLQKNLGDGVRKASDVPEDKLPVAIGAIKTAIADNPFNRKRDYA